MLRSLARCTLFCALSLALSPTALADDITPSHTGSWWNPNDSGWGVYTFDQGNVLGPYWISYDEQGRPTWFMGLTLPQADGSFAGDLYRFTGKPYQNIVGTSVPSANQPGQVVGQVKLVFDSNYNKMQFITTIDGHTRSHPLERFNFNGKNILCSDSPLDRRQATNYTDMWWEEATSGWGIHVMHVDNQLYGYWHTYESPNRAVYLTLALERQADGRYVGKIFRQNDGSRPFNATTDASSHVGATEVGTASLTFINGERAEFDFVVGSRAGSHIITRFQVGDTATTCMAVPYGDPEESVPSDGELCYPPYKLGDTHLWASESQSGTSGAVVRTRHRLKIAGSAQFNGHSALVTEISDPDSGNKIFGRDYVGNGDGTRLSFGAESVDKDTGSLLSISRNDPSSVSVPRRFKIGETLTTQYKVNSTASGISTTSNITVTTRLLGKEPITVPAGTYNACKFEVTTETKTTSSTLNTQTLTTGFSWSDSEVGQVKTEYEGTTTTTIYGYSNTEENRATSELVEVQMGQ